MTRTDRHPICRLTVLLLFVGYSCAWPLAAAADDEEQAFELAAVLAQGIQCQNVREGDGDDVCSGALLAQPEFSYRPTPRDEFNILLGFASSNLLNNRSPLDFSPWAADLEDDVEDINGRNRDYLLKARYGHRFEWTGGRSLTVSGGLIDATDHLDDNRYANDDFAQFMSVGLVNGPNSLVPSYDPGAAFDLRGRHWSVHGVYMDIDRNGDGMTGDSDADYFGLQVALHPETPLGPGSYRLVLARTSKDFEGPDGTSNERREDLIVSADQQLGQNLGAFVRIELQSDNAAIVSESTWTGGLELSGGAWRRAQDTFGLGLVYVDGGNLDLRDGYGGEAYYRSEINEVWALSGNLQYAFGDRIAPDNSEVWTVGLRIVAEL